MSEKQSADKEGKGKKQQRPPEIEQAQPEQSTQEMLAKQAGGLPGLPDHPTARSLRQAAVLQMQRQYGNAFVQKVLTISGKTRERALQRFEGEEHEQLGTRATGGLRTTNLYIGPGQVITFGEMTALAGDWFESVAEMQSLARDEDGRQQLQWARWKGLGERGPEPSVSAAVKTACMNRYYRLAASNVSHFSAGGTAGSNYRANHESALSNAFEGGITDNGRLISAATTIEAFGSHFLTDMFSAGHVRTPREEQRRWYQRTHPQALTQIIDYMAGIMHSFLRHQHPWLAHVPILFPDQSQLAEQIRSIGGPAVSAMSLGDLVSMAYHDRDNQLLHVISDLDHYGNEVAGGFHWRAVGDNYLNSAEGYWTRTMANRALQASLADLATLEQAGRRVGSQYPRLRASPAHLTESFHWLRMIYQREVNAIKTNNKYQAERYIPRVDPGANNVTMDWQWGAFNADMRIALDNLVKGRIATELAEKSRELRARGSRRDTYAADALNVVVRRLRKYGIRELETAIGSPAGP